MSLEFYSKLGTKARTLIKKYGRNVPLRRVTNGVIESRGCWIVRTQFNPRMVDGDLIRFTDHRYIMNDDVDPPPDSERDRLVVDGQDLRIVAAPPLKPADVVLLYDVQARL